MTPHECSPRDLARKIEELAREHPCFSQVTTIVDVMCGYMCAIARLQEMNQDAARTQQTMTFSYKNYRGELSSRHVRPLGPPRWGTSEWYPEPQWLLMAWDLDKGAAREFALDNIDKSTIKQFDR
jgi:hypothetical protein